MRDMTLEQAVLGFAVVALLLTIVPGLDTALVLRTVLTRSRAEAFAVTAGIQLGTLAWGAVAAVGAGALLTASQVAYQLLTFAGAGYLVWLGARMLVRGLGAPQQNEPRPDGDARRGRLGALGTGLLTNLLNPKVGVFYLATIPQFVPEGVSPMAMGLLLAAVHCAFGTIWSVAIVLGGSVLGSRLRSARFVRWVDRITGGVLVVMGIRLAVAARV